MFRLVYVNGDMEHAILKHFMTLPYLQRVVKLKSFKKLRIPLGNLKLFLCANYHDYDNYDCFNEYISLVTCNKYVRLGHFSTLLGTQCVGGKIGFFKHLLSLSRKVEFTRVPNITITRCFLECNR